MDAKEINDIISAAEIYAKNLLKLEQNITEAKKQIANSASVSMQNIESVFSNLKKAVINELETRQAELKQTVLQIQTNGLNPLNECQNLIQEKITEANNLVEQGHTILQNSTNGNYKKFYSQSELLGNLPAVPTLTEVSFIHFSYLENTQCNIVDLCKNFGVVSHKSPVQIISLTEKPGGILVQWEESNDISEVQEFRLQYAFGDSLNYYDCYTGPNAEYLKRDMKLNEPYSFRVCCKVEGSQIWSPWSVCQLSKTTISPFCWNEAQTAFALNDENKLATKLLPEPMILLSERPQLEAGHCIEFTILDIFKDSASCIDGVGLCSEEDAKFLNVGNFCSLNTFVVLLSGKIFVEGQEKSTKLPELHKNSKISFSCEEVNDKVRVCVECADKSVTYDWKIPDKKMYFFIAAESLQFKVLVE